MTKIISFVRPKKPNPPSMEGGPAARAWIADAAFLGRRIAPPAITAAVIAAICGAPVTFSLPLLGTGLTLWMGVVLDACFPFSAVGPLQRYFGAR